jgi:hypothetical protein
VLTLVTINKHNGISASILSRRIEYGFVVLFGILAAESMNPKQNVAVRHRLRRPGEFSGLRNCRFTIFYNTPEDLKQS